MKKLKTGDKVVVVSGSNKGKEGKITKILDSKVIVEGVNIVKKHLKPKNNGGNGEIIETEAAIHVSNVMLVDPKTIYTPNTRNLFSILLHTNGVSSNVYSDSD